MNDQIVTGIVVAVVSGGLFVVLVPRLVRKLGKVDCELYWQPTQGAGSVGSPGREVHERQLVVTYTNRKDVPVTVRSMEVMFYRQGKPLDAGEHPHVQFITRDGSGPGPFELVSLPPFVPVTRRVIVYPGDNEHRRQRAVEEAGGGGGGPGRVRGGDRGGQDQTHGASPLERRNAPKTAALLTLPHPHTPERGLRIAPPLRCVGPRVVRP